jgi:hypothetical protein
VLSGEATNTNFIVFGLTQLGFNLDGRKTGAGGKHCQLSEHGVLFIL